jgi:hypothetical protein
MPCLSGALGHGGRKTLGHEPVFLRSFVGGIEDKIARHLLRADDVRSRLDDLAGEQRKTIAEAHVPVVGLAVQDIERGDAQHPVIADRRLVADRCLGTAQRNPVESVRPTCGYLGRRRAQQPRGDNCASDRNPSQHRLSPAPSSILVTLSRGLFCSWSQE